MWYFCVVYLSDSGDQQAKREGDLQHGRRVALHKAAGRAADANRDQQKRAQTLGDQDAPDVSVVGDVGDADDLLQACVK